jgi:putative nucleotidyltransferase with HDIG domain
VDLDKFSLADAPTRLREMLLWGYAAVLMVVAGATALALLATDPGRISLTVLVLCVLALLAEALSVRLGPRAEISVGFVPVVFAAVVYGGLGAMIVAGAGLLCHLRRPYLRWLTWTASGCFVAGAAGAVAHTLSASTNASFMLTFAAVSAALAIEQIGMTGLTLAAASIRGARPKEFTRVIHAVLLAIPLYAPVLSLLIYAYREVSAWSAGLFLLPAFAAQRLFLLYREQRETAEQLSSAIEQLERANLSFATALVATLDARDRYTAGHSASVAIYARDIARKLELPEGEQRLAHVAGLVHDIGKIGLPPGLLEKPGPLTLEERRHMETHSIVGESILQNVDDYAEIAQIVRHHHERVDGQGYPDRLSENAIPLLSRIIAVADAYNAMTSDRPYRDAMSSHVARLRLAQAAGSQFDASVVAAFEEILATADLAYLKGSVIARDSGARTHPVPTTRRGLAVAGAA